MRWTRAGKKKQSKTVQNGPKTIQMIQEKGDDEMDAGREELTVWQRRMQMALTAG